MSQPIHDNTDEVPLVQAAAELKMSYLRCRDMALRGELEVVLRGRYWFITRSSLDEALADRRRELIGTTSDVDA